MDLISNDLNEEELELVKIILNSTNYSYINIIINKYEKKLNIKLPRYKYGKGLPIGNMTSQFLAVFYLSKLQHYIRHNLHLIFINYMDDYIIIHQDKEYLKYCLNIIKVKLYNEYKLELNKNKTIISSSNNGINFLGYNFKVINKKTIITLSQNTKRNIIRGIKRNKYLYNNNLINFNSLFSSIETYKYSYKYVNKIYVKNIFNRYF